MAYLFTFLLLIAFVGTIVCLIKPSMTQIKTKPALTRGKIFLYGLLLNFILLALVGVTAPEVEPKNNEVAKLENTENKVEPTAEIKEPTLPAKAEASLGMTPEQFRQKFNAELKTLNIDTIRPLAEFDIEDGSVRDSFKVMFSQNLGMTGIVNKDGSLREILFIFSGGTDYEKATIDMIILTGITARIISPDTEAGNETINLMTKALKNMEQEENTHKKVFGNVEYYALASKVTGLWVGVSPVEE